MFRGYNKGVLDVSNFDTSKATNMQGMFLGVKEVTGLEGFKTDQVTDMSFMFYDYGDQTKDLSLDLSNWNVNNVGNFDQMFGSAYLKSVNLGSWAHEGPLKGIFSGSLTTKTTQLTLSPQDNLKGSGLLGLDNYLFPEDKAKYTGNWENIKDQYSIDPNKVTYSTDGLITMYSDSSTAPKDNETYIWEPTTTPGNPVTVHYVDQDGKTIQADKQVPGDYDAKYTISPDSISGYDYVGVKDGSLTGTYDSEAKEVTLAYKKATPTTGGNTVTEPAADSASESTSEAPEADQTQPDSTNPVAKKNRAVTAVKKLGLYRTPNFSKRTRIAYYAKQSRTKRPQFVIIGVAQSKNGVKRYLVRDVNHGTKRDGQTGYITAKSAFTTHTYYQSNPKTVKILARVNGYRDKALKHQVKAYKPGQVLHVKKLVHYRLTTRLVLRDGTFVTGNKVKLIMK
jgi:surface protein